VTVAVTAAAHWLRGQLRPDGQWRGPGSWARDPAETAAWRDAAEQITARIPDLADLLHHAIGEAHARNGVLAATGRLTARPGHLVRVAQWSPAPVEHRSYVALRTALDAAARIGRDLATAVGVSPRLGLEHAQSARRSTFGPPPTPPRLAEQWYPQPNGMQQPTASAAAAHPASQPRPGQGRTR
jgi:hypothetical protein